MESNYYRPFSNGKSLNYSLGPDFSRAGLHPLSLRGKAVYNEPTWTSAARSSKTTPGQPSYWILELCSITSSFCDHSLANTDIGAKPAIAQSSPSLNAARATSCTVECGLLKTRQFLSLQSDQATSRSRESNRGREAESTRRRWRSHHTPTSSSSAASISDESCRGRSVANQTCLAKTHPRNRWPPVSGS